MHQAVNAHGLPLPDSMPRQMSPLLLDRHTTHELHSTFRLNDMRSHCGIDRTLAALAHPARRGILRRLSQGEVRVTALARPFAMSLNAVSKHIRVLERARLVRRRRVGREHLLSVRPAPLDEVASWIGAQRAMWTERLDKLEALLLEEDRISARARKAVRKRLPR